MTIRVGINGFGRIGRLVTRAGWNNPNIKFTHINEPHGGIECATHLLEFDTIHGHFKNYITYNKNIIKIDKSKIHFSEFLTPGEVDWNSTSVDIVLECSGQFRTIESLEKYFKRGVKKVIVACPIMDTEALNIVYGVNDSLYNAEEHKILTAASCTTNCLAPIVKVIHENLGIIHGSFTTIHNITNTQVLVDAPHKDLRRARSAINAMIPTSTGSATAISFIYPELKGKLNGHAVRVPSLSGSLTDCVFEIKRKTSAKEVNEFFKIASKNQLKGILGIEDRPLVSTDYVGDPRSSIIDGLSTMVVDDTHLKIYAWYDNEWGYANRMIDITLQVAKKLN